MITGKAGPAFQHRTIEEALQQSLWLLEGRNSAGERLPDDSSLAEANGDLDVLIGKTVWMPTKEK